MTRISQGQVFDDVDSGGPFQPNARAALPGALPPTSIRLAANPLLPSDNTNQHIHSLITDRPLYVYMIGDSVPVDGHLLYGLGDTQPGDDVMWRARGFRVVLDRPGRWHLVNRSTTSVELVMVDAAEVGYGTHFAEGGLVTPTIKSVFEPPNSLNIATNGNVLVAQRNPRRRALWMMNAGSLLGGSGGPIAISFDAQNTATSPIFDGTGGSEPASLILPNVNAPDWVRLTGDEMPYGQVRASSITNDPPTYTVGKLIVWEWE